MGWREGGCDCRRSTPGHPISLSPHHCLVNISFPKPNSPVLYVFVLAGYENAPNNGKIWRGICCFQLGPISMVAHETVTQPVARDKHSGRPCCLLPGPKARSSPIALPLQDHWKCSPSKPLCSSFRCTFKCTSNCTITKALHNQHGGGKHPQQEDQGHTHWPSSK